jgi:phage/plasmid-associated DNA primase
LVALRNNGKFTMTTDQYEMMREYQEISNPILGFVEEWEWYGIWRPRNEVYNDYLQWCSRSHAKPFSARKFWPQLRRMTTFEDKQTGAIRMIRLEKRKERNF